MKIPLKLNFCQYVYVWVFNKYEIQQIDDKVKTIICWGRIEYLLFQNHLTSFKNMSEITKKEIDCIKGNILAEDRFSFYFTFFIIVDGNCIIKAPTNFSNYLKVILSCQEMKRIQDRTAGPSTKKHHLQTLTLVVAGSIGASSSPPSSLLLLGFPWF